MQQRAKVVIIGAGIVGCSTAYHLAQKGWRDIVVIDQGPLFATGGSTSHAPGLIFQTNPSKMMTNLASYAVKFYSQFELDGQPCFYPVGSMEVARTPERWEDLKRKIGFSRSYGLEGARLLTPQESREKNPLLDPNTIYGSYFVPSDGIAKAVKVCEAMSRDVADEGVSFYGETPVTDIIVEGGRARGVETPRGSIEAEYVLICAGIWGPLVGRMAGVTIPLVPVQHQYVITEPLAELAEDAGKEVVHPILRDQDRAMYARQVGAAYGVGSYQHEPLVTDPEEIRSHREAPIMPSIVDFTPEHFAKPWSDVTHLMPPLKGRELVYRINGMFSFTPDGYPVLGETKVPGLWVAEAVWVTHGGGVGKVMAEWMADGAPSIDLREGDIHRFEPYALTRSYVVARGEQQYREVYDIIHPLQQMENPRPLRTSPFYATQKELGATFFEGRGWERPQWFAANETLLGSLEGDEGRAAVPERSGWAGRYWSPIIGAEHLATRERVALFDMTPLTRAEVSGPGALDYLQRLSSNQLDRPVGAVTYAAMLDQQGRIKSDVTVARLGQDRFQIGLNGPSDLAWMRRHLPEDGSVHLQEITSAQCGVGVWGPRARDLLQQVTDADLSNEAFPYYTVREIEVGEVPVIAMRVSYVGELGWELYTPCEYGTRLWNLLWQAGQPYDVVAAGRGAFDSLRLEKGYRLWGNDMHTEYNPYEAGIGFVVNWEKGDFLGREALRRTREEGPSRRLCCLTFDDPSIVVMGKEPVYIGDQIVGYVTSANFGYSVGRSIAYSYLPTEHAKEGTAVEVEYFDLRYPATVTREPLYDPKGTRLKS